MGTMTVEDFLKAAMESADLLVLSSDSNVLHLFQNAGFRHIEVVRNGFEKVTEVLAEDKCDLLIIDDGFDEAGAAKFIKKIRHGQFGENIFLPIVTLLSSNDMAAVGGTINAGSDDVVVKPLSVDIINSRIIALLKRTVQYVVTQDYIGPNRRPKERTQDKDNLVDIPNALRAKSQGHHDISTDLNAKIKAANDKINEQRVSVQGDQINQLITLSVADAKRFDLGMKKIKAVSSEFTDRLARTDFAHVSELCRMLNVVVDEIRGIDDKKNVELLLLMGRSISLSFKDDIQAKQSAMEAVGLIKAKFEGRTA
jgi:DNA-binding response OmpR family regulator